MIVNSLRQLDYNEVLNLTESQEIKRYDVGYVHPLNHLLNDLKSDGNFEFTIETFGLASTLARVYPKA